MQPITRRHFVKAAIACAAVSTIAKPARALWSEPARRLHLCNIHTGESLKTVYWEEGAYNTEALKDIAYILRDYRTNDMLPIEPHLLDVLTALHSTLDSRRPFEIISGYRTPRTNAMLHEHSSGVAVNSLHMVGKAIDIRLGDKPTTAIRDAAWNLQQGGVGYYHASDFVHIDTGPVNWW
jgi:uncharacterized protein YcbK (DUF882 family)